MTETRPFLIRHPDGREFALRDVAAFKRQYQREGFAIVDPVHPDYRVPDLTPPRREPPADIVIDERPAPRKKGF